MTISDVIFWGVIAFLFRRPIAKGALAVMVTSARLLSSAGPKLAAYVAKEEAKEAEENEEEAEEAS